MVSSMHMTIIILISIILMMMMMLMKMKFKLHFNSIYNVECGFNSMNQKKFKFPNQFFLIAILFVIFDMELVAILPMPISNPNIVNKLIMFSIILLLAFSVMMEWLNGLVEWIKS